MQAVERRALEEDRVYARSESLVTRRIAGETLIVPVSGELAGMRRIFTLNGVAEFIWESLDGTRSLKEIRDALIERFEVDRARAEEDILEFLGELLEAQLVFERS